VDRPGLARSVLCHRQRCTQTAPAARNDPDADSSGALFVLFIGTCEVLGALGLVLPSVLRIRPGLTIVAASCLALLTLCAATYQLMAAAPVNAVLALIFGALAAFVAYGRWRLAPVHSARQQTFFLSRLHQSA
jgi:DoxX-like family